MKEILLIVEELIFKKTGNHLNTLERDILRGTYLGQTYDTIAEEIGFSVVHVKNVGTSLWHKLSKVLGEKVYKKNLRSVVDRIVEKEKSIEKENLLPKYDRKSELNYDKIKSSTYFDRPENGQNQNLNRSQNGSTTTAQKQQTSIKEIDIQQKKSITLYESPKGPLSLDSPFYIEPQQSITLSERVISSPGGLLRIKAPQKMGKTSLTIRIAQKAIERRYQPVYLNFQLADRKICQDLDLLLKWFCANVGLKLQLPNQIANYWDDILGYKMSCNSYFQDYILAEISQPLVLILDRVDYIFAYPEIAEDFFALLRAWYEEAKTINIWKKLRLVLVYSTEVYLPLNINQSPFNVGVSLELPQFLPEQVRELSERYQLSLNNDEIEALIAMVGGHPYLIQIALYHLKKEKISVEKFLLLVNQKKSPYSKHLQELLNCLYEHSDLANTFEHILTNNSAYEQLEYRELFKLNSMGLIEVKRDRIKVACELYRQFFRQKISQLI